MNKEVVIRRLGADDAALYRELRLRALKVEDKSVFGSTFDEEAALPEEHWENSLSRPTPVFGALIGDMLVGSLGTGREEREKMKHRGWIWGVWVAPEHRGAGAATGLFQAACDWAWSVGVEQLHFQVGVANVDAIAFYEAMGCVQYARDEKVLKSGTDYFDEYWYRKDL